MAARLSLVDRVSLFFLTALAAVLVGYSAMLYAAVSMQLRRQFDEQLGAAFNVLVAAIEVEPDDVKFEPSDHTIALGAGGGEGEIRWAIFDGEGRLVDRSRSLRPGERRDDAFLENAARPVAAGESAVELGPWRVLRRRLAANHPKPARERDPLERSELWVTVGRSPDDLRATLRLLAVLATAAPAVVLALAAVIGRRYCRRALQPLRDMAEQARSMACADADRRLAVPAPRDELAELGTAFNSVLDRLFESLERQRRFAGDAAHQLRTPLTAVLGQLDVALRRPRAADEYRQALTTVREKADELRQIIESLLFLAQATDDAVLPGSRRIDLAGWLADYRHARSGHARLADLELAVDSTATGEVCVPPVLLKQLLDNLVDNAFRYSDAGTKVRVTLDRTSNRFQLAVHDQGQGISSEDVPHVFQPFFRSASARLSGTEGTGLGLAVAARIATAFGGGLMCESQINVGSRFLLTIPAAESAWTSDTSACPMALPSG